jgi:transglutaminase-like putative cysteine protease
MLSGNIAKEPIHLLLLRGLIYSAVLLAALWPLASLAVILAVVATALAGLVLGRRLAVSRLRYAVVAAGSAGLALGGCALGYWLGSAAWVARAVGTSLAMDLVQGTCLCMVTLCGVVSLRVLALRRPYWTALEVTAGAAVMISLFAGYRGFQIAQPRYLADWAFSTGRDPWAILGIVGLVSVATLVVLLLPRQRIVRNLMAIVVIWLLLLLVFAPLSAWWLERGASANNGSQVGFSPDEDKLNFQDRKVPTPGNNRPVALVMFTDAYTPLDGVYHFRTRAHSQLAANRLTPTTVIGANPDVPADFPGGKTTVSGAELPANLASQVDTTFAYIVKHKSPACLISPVALEPATNPDPKYFVQVYGVRSSSLAENKARQIGPALLRMPAGSPAWADAVRQHYLALPGDQRYKELADRLIAEAVSRRGQVESPLARGQMFVEWIQDNTTYTFTPGNGDATDPTADFLFGSRKGFCVHFSSAVCYLLRSQGIPARVAVGYAAPLERRGRGSSLLLQESDGHAWCEVYLNGAGWVPLDGSPKKSSDPLPEEPSPDVKNFMQNKFEDSRVKQQTAVIPAPEEGTPDETALLFWRLLLALLLLLIVLPLLLLFVLYTVKAWRGFAPRFASARHLHRVCYRAVLDRLAEVGLLRRFGETREQFAERLSATIPELLAITDQHMRGAMCGPGHLDRTQGLLLQEQVRQRLKHQFSRPSRYLGLLNPISWIFVR